MPLINLNNFAISTRRGSLVVKGTVPNSYFITKSGLNGFKDFWNKGGGPNMLKKLVKIFFCPWNYFFMILRSKVCVLSNLAGQSLHCSMNWRGLPDLAHLFGDQIRPMSKVREKRSTSKSGFFSNKMWTIIGKIDDFDRFLNNSRNLGVFLAKNKKYPKMTVLKKWKLKIFF